MKNQRNITFNIGEENRIVVEDIDDKVLESSIFSEPYRYALDALNSYFKSMPKEKDKRLSEDELWRNNIFAFIGDRGTGKTSCMQSIAKLLVDSPKLQGDNPVQKEKFYKIDMVDPSFVDNDSNVVGVILASLYKQYSKYSSEHACNDKKRIELASRFDRVQRDFCRMMAEQDVAEDDLEALSTLSAAIDLKQSMLELIDCFMSYIDQEGAILLIPIDDIDLHSKDATYMVEQIRKYLVLPNVVVLMAVKMSQLAKLKRLQFSKEYQDARNTLSDTELDEMVEKYLTKLVPYGHRVYMPDATFYWNALLTIKNGEDIEHKNVSIRQFIPELIFRKTRYLFYNSSIKTSYIVPDNLRELRQLLCLLYEMNDYFYKVGDEIREEVNNKMIFKKYLFQSWMMNHLDANSQSLIKELLAVTDSIQMNAFTLRIIRQKFFLEDDSKRLVAPWHSEERDAIRQELDYVMRKDNMVYNVALGDVMAVLDYLERLDITSEQMYFLFMVKTIYSIRLYEYFLDYADELQATLTNATVKSDMESGKIVLRRKLYESLQLPDYMKLLGGRIFNTRASVVLPFPQKKDGVSRSNRVINLRKLNELVQKCIDQSDEVSADEIRMAEFFMLCTARVYRSQNKPQDQNDYYEPNFRTNKSLVYAVSLASKPNAFFDIASFMYNVIDIERCYGRFVRGEEFYNKIKSGESNYRQSFWQTLRNKNLQRFNKDSYDTLTARQRLGWFCIRNMEILKDLTVYLDESEYKGSGGDLTKLEEFFTYLNNYRIHSYDKNIDSKEYCTINYSFVEPIPELLKNVAGNNELKETFFLIYDGYKAKNIDKDLDDDDDMIELPALLTQYSEKSLTEEVMRGFIVKQYIQAKSLKKNIRQFNPVFNEEPFSKILNESISSNDFARVKPDDIRGIFEAITSKIQALNPNGNAEANHQDVVHAPEE